MRDVAVVRDQRPHLRVIEAIDSDDLDQPPGAVAVTASNLGDDRFPGTVERVREELPGALEIIGVDELEDAPSHELFEPVSEHPRDRSARERGGRILPDERDRVEAVLDDGPIGQRPLVFEAHGRSRLRERA